MNIHEHQAKALFRANGIPVPEGEVAFDAKTAGAIAKRFGGTVVVKTQIHAGGRGKGTFRTPEGEPVLHPTNQKPLGGVVVVPNDIVAEAVASRMLGNVLVTKQTGEEGKFVRRIFIEQGVAIAKEYYLALVLDRGTCRPTFIASAEGGTEIEEVAASRPEAIIRVGVDPVAGFQPWIGRRLAFGLGLGKEQVKGMTQMAAALLKTFLKTDASQVEINPLILTEDGALMALDGKMNFDDNALYRHKDIAELRDLSEEDPLEIEAGKIGLNYIKLDGSVGCMVNGAGLAMATMDIIQHHGGSPANFLDVGGGATEEMVTEAFRIILGDKHVKAVLINIFGGIMRCDVVAAGVVSAARQLGVEVPVVVRLEGTNVERGREILAESEMKIIVAKGMRDAAEKVVEAAAGGQG